MPDARTEIPTNEDRPRLWTCPACGSRWYLAACPLDGALRPPPPTPPPPEERPTVASEEVEGRFVLLGSAIVLSNEYGEWTEIVTDRATEDDGILLITSTGRPVFVRHDGHIRVPVDVAEQIRSMRARGWDR